jgi:hypothetical protein
MAVSQIGRRSAFHGFLFFFAAFFLVIPARAQDVDLDILDYRLSLHLDLEEKGIMAPLNSMAGTARITFRNGRTTAMPRVPVLLNRVLKLKAARTGEGQPLDFDQSLVALENWETYHAMAASVTLVEPLPAGGTTTLELDYAGALSGYQEAGMLYVQESLDPEFTMIRAETSAYPHLAEPTKESVRRFFGGGDPFNQFLEVDVPEGLIVASGHDLVERRKHEGRVTWIYRSRAPSFQIILPVAPYEIIEVGPNRIYYFPEDREGAQRVSAGIASAMQLFTHWFGPLHDRSPMAVIEIPEWYGSQALRPTILQEATAFREAAGMPELYHELSHFWNVPDPATEPSRWNEGLAMYLQYLVAQELEGEAGWLDRGMQELHERLRGHLRENPGHRGVPLIRVGERGLTSALAYTGGGLFFGLLHHRVGQQRLLSTLRDYHQRYYDSGATSEEFAEFLATRAPNAQRILDEWFLGDAYSELVMQSPDVETLIARYEKE